MLSSCTVATSPPGPNFAEISQSSPSRGESGSGALLNFAAAPPLAPVVRSFVHARPGRVWELELELIQPHMAQKPVLRGEVGCACVAREVSVERGGMGERGCARRLGGWVWV